VPALSGQEEGGAVGVAVAMLKAGGIVAVVLVSARFVVPRLLHQVVHTRSRELFLVTVILMCLGIALLTSRFGLSLALGAFLAGLILSESDYGAQAMADILPLKDVFMGLFFVSIGMLMDTGYLTANLPLVGGTVVGLFVIKAAAAGGSLLAIGTPPRVALHAGLGIAQIGEFSFILAEVGRAGGLITADLFQLFLSAAVVTMALTPLVLAVAPGAAGWIASKGTLGRIDREAVDEEVRPRVTGHVVIVGFGFNGRNLATVLKASGIPYVVLEMNAATVLEQRTAGEPIYYGDGTNVHLLEKLGIGRARILVVAISDAASTRNVVATARRVNPKLRIIVRTRYLAEVDDLAELGADEVIPEEFETSVEVFSRVLHRFNVPRNIISDHIEAVRKDEYRAFRTHRLPVKSVGDRREMMDHMDSVTYLVKEHAVLAGHTLRELELRARSGATVMAYQRGEEVVQNPGADYVVREGDVLLLVGTPEDLNRATAYLDSDEFLPSKYH
jgi:CPA2 family monovalent cation:H+ antiporter-2